MKEHRIDKEDGAEKNTKTDIKLEKLLCGIDINCVESIKTKQYTILFFLNSDMQQNKKVSSFFYFFRPFSTINTNSLPDLDNCLKCYALSIPFEIINTVKLDYRQYLSKSTVNEEFQQFESNSFTQLIFTSIKMTNTMEDSIKKTLLLLKMKELLVYLIEQNGKSVLNYIMYQPNFNQKEFVNLMKNNIKSNLSLSELAQLSNMSASKFKRIFFEIFNETPIRWFRKQRIKESCHFLKESSKTIEEISDLMGYRNSSNFIKVFKSIYKITPNEYRESHLLKNHS